MKRLIHSTVITIPLVILVLVFGLKIAEVIAFGAFSDSEAVQVIAL